MKLFVAAALALNQFSALNCLYAGFEDNSDFRHDQVGSLTCA